MKSTREILQGPAGKAIAIAVVIAGGVGVYLAVRGDGPSLADVAGRRTFVDAESGQSFQASLSAGETLPIKSPFTGKATGVTAELCYWTADGTPKATPDAVCLNEFRIPARSGPTFCPVCHRLVVGHNPAARSGDKPPPTETEYASHKAE